MSKQTADDLTIRMRSILSVDDQEKADAADRERGLPPLVPSGVNIFLDDCRSAPDGYVLVKTARECIDALKKGDVVHLSLDHDLGDGCLLCWTDTGSVLVKGCSPDCQCDCHPTGYSVCLWMAENNVWPRYAPRVHSANPVGAANMHAVIARYWRAPP